MVQADARDHRHHRPGDVRGIESASEAGLEDGDVDLRPGEMVEGRGCHHLEPGGDAAAAADGWAEIARRLAEQRHDFYVLDEFTYPLNWGWVDVEEVVEVLLSRPGRQHVVITGRDAPQRLLEAADLVTEMVKVKHPMDAGRKGQRGIEW